MMFIDTGSEKSKVAILYECPICGEQFDRDDGVHLKSETIGDTVFVCGRHHEPLTVEQELAIQNALARAIENKRGRVTQDGVVIKKHYLYEKYSKEKW